MCFLDNLCKPISVAGSLQLVVISMLLQGCSVQSWVVDKYSEFSKPKERAYSNAAEKFQVYDKKLGRTIGLGRCAINTRLGINEFIEFSAPDLRGFDDTYLTLQTQQKALKADRDRIRAVIRSTTVDPDNLLEPYSHVSGFAEVWYDSITPQNWKAIDKRIEAHIRKVEGLAAISTESYNQVFLKNPTVDRSPLMRPVFCASAVPLIEQAAKLDKPGYFDMAHNLHYKKSGRVNPIAWLANFDNKTSQHVSLANKINSYRDECRCYAGAQSGYKSHGARFYIQTLHYGDSFCAATQDKELEEIEEQLRNFISTVNTEKLGMEEMIDKKIINKFIESFLEREDDPFPQISGSELLEELGAKSDIFYHIAQVQYAHSRREREEHNIKIARKTLTCLHDARAKGAGNLYLGADFVDEET
jgi:hypothetical protein